MQTRTVTGWAPKNPGVAAVQARSLQLVARAPRVRTAQQVAREVIALERIALEEVAKEIPPHRQNTSDLKSPATHGARWTPPDELRQALPAIDIEDATETVAATRWKDPEDEDDAATADADYRAYVVVPSDESETVHVPRLMIGLLDAPDPAGIAAWAGADDNDADDEDDVPVEQLPVIVMSMGFEMESSRALTHAEVAELKAADDDDEDSLSDDDNDEHAPIAVAVVAAKVEPAAPTQATRTVAPAAIPKAEPRKAAHAEPTNAIEHRSRELARRAVRPVSSRRALEQLRH